LRKRLLERGAFTLQQIAFVSDRRDPGLKALLFWALFQGVEQAAEKVLNSGEVSKKKTAGTKVPFFFSHLRHD
jgi:hypothetical protein